MACKQKERGRPLSPVVRHKSGELFRRFRKLFRAIESFLERYEWNRSYSIPTRTLNNADILSTVSFKAKRVKTELKLLKTTLSIMNHINRADDLKGSKLGFRSSGLTTARLKLSGKEEEAKNILTF